MTDTPTPASASEPVSLKAFLLAAVLWLPLAFFLWYMLRPVVVFPVAHLSGWVLTSWMPELYAGAGQRYETFIYSVLANVSGVPGLPNAPLEIELTANPLIYSYGLAVLAGLVMATPLDWTRTFIQLFVGWLLLLPFQTFSLVGEAFRDCAFNFGAAVQSGLVDAGYEAVAHQAGAVAQQSAMNTLAGHGLGLEVIGLWYQLGFLILPSIAPVIVWALLNRHFIEGLRDSGAETEEPPPPAAGPSDVNKETP